MSHLRTKTLAALIAALALTALGAATASAHEFTATKTPGKLTGGGVGKLNQLFKFGAVTVSCDAKVAEGEIPKSPAETLAVGVKYENCAGFGSEKVTITPVIKYLFHASGSVDLQSEIPLKFGIEIFHCVVTIPSKETFAAVKYASGGSPSVVEATMQASAYIWKAAGQCATVEDGTHNAGLFQGTVAIGENEGSLEFK